MDGNNQMYKVTHLQQYIQIMKLNENESTNCIINLIDKSC